MLKKLLVIATLAAGLISTQASAAFVPTDWKVGGDKGAVLDEGTGVEWLRLESTRNQSFDTILSQLETTYAGWRLPTYSEVTDMISRFFSQYGANPFAGSIETRGGVYLTAAQAFAKTFGNTKISGRHHVGMYLDDSGSLRYVGAYSDGSSSYSLYFGLGVTSVLNFSSVYNSGGNWGTFLVSDGGTTLSSINDPALNINNPNAPINMADVSAPAGLAAAGLLMLMLGARRKTA